MNGSRADTCVLDAQISLGLRLARVGIYVGVVAAGMVFSDGIACRYLTPITDSRCCSCAFKRPAAPSLFFVFIFLPKPMNITMPEQSTLWIMMISCAPPGSTDASSLLVFF